MRSPFFNACLVFLLTGSLYGQVFSHTKRIAIAGDDLSALWSAYLLAQELEKNKSCNIEIDLIGDSFDSFSLHYMPLKRSPNVSSLLRVGFTGKEMLEIGSLQAMNEREIYRFYSKYNATGWKGRRMGSYLALGNEQEEHLYTDWYFRLKLPLTTLSEEKIPAELFPLVAEWKMYQVPFDSVLDEGEMKKLLLSALLEERAEKPKVSLHSSICERVKEDGDKIELTLQNGDILSCDACAISLEERNLPILRNSFPELEYDLFQEVTLTALTKKATSLPYFVEFPSEEVYLIFGEEHILCATRVFNSQIQKLTHRREKTLISQAVKLYPLIDEIQEIRARVLLSPKGPIPEVSYPKGKDFPLFILSYDQRERISLAAAMGYLGSKAMLDFLQKREL